MGAKAKKELHQQKVADCSKDYEDQKNKRPNLIM